MKTPGEILDTNLDKLRANVFVKMFYAVNREKALELIESIQTEAWNEAIEEAAKVDVQIDIGQTRIKINKAGRRSILKLKKKTLKDK